MAKKVDGNWKERYKKATHSYIGRKSCGCVVAARVDTGDKDTANDVADFIKSGLSIERVTHEVACNLLTFDCPHRLIVPELQPRLFGDEAQS